MGISPEMFVHLDKRCKRIHVHQPLVSGCCAAATFDPSGLVRATLRGIKDTLRARKAANETNRERQRAIMAAAISVSSGDVEQRGNRGKLGVTKISKLAGGTLEHRRHDNHQGEILRRMHRRRA